MLTRESDFRLTEIKADEMSATDLQREAATLAADGTPFECYRLQSNDVGEVGWVLSSGSRAGVAWGSEAQWTDCTDAEDAVRRFLTGDMIE